MIGIKTGMVLMTESSIGFRTVREELNLQQFPMNKTALISVSISIVR